MFLFTSSILIDLQVKNTLPGSQPRRINTAEYGLLKLDRTKSSTILSVSVCVTEVRSFVLTPSGESERQFLVDPSERHDEHEIDHRARHGGDQLRHRPQSLVLEQGNGHQRPVDDHSQDEDQNQADLEGEEEEITFRYIETFFFINRWKKEKIPSSGGAFLTFPAICAYS